MYVRAAETALIAVGALFVLSAPGRAHACATCSVGDPTLTVMGAEQPTEQRTRISLEALHRTDQVGRADLDRLELSEQRFETGIAHAPVPWLMLSATLPLVRRTVTYVNLAEQTSFGLGDVEVRARAFLYRDRQLAPRHLISALVGLELPTAPLHEDRDGQAMPIELQAGSGSFDPFAGVAWSFFADPLSFYSSLIVVVPTEGTADSRSGTSASASLVLQYQPWPSLGGQLGLDGQLSAASREAGGREPDSGGFIGFISPGIVYSPITDLVVHAIVRIPTVQMLTGQHREGVVFNLGAAFDL